MHGLRSISTLLWAPHKAGLRRPLLMLSPCLRTPRMLEFHTTSALLCFPDLARVRKPLVILSPCLGTPENAGVM